MARRKIEIKRIEDPDRRQVTFSKRRTGLFKKTAELCSSYGAEAAVFTFSPIKERPYVFAHPNPYSVIDRFLNENNNNNNNNDSHFAVKEEAEGKREEEERKGFWWEQPIDDLDLEDLLKFKAALAKVKRNVDKLADETKMQSISVRNYMGVDSDATVVQEPVVGGERGSYVDGGNVPQGFGSDRKIATSAIRDYLGESSATGMVRGPVDGDDQRQWHGDVGGYVPQGFGFYDFMARGSK